MFLQPQLLDKKKLSFISEERKKTQTLMLFFFIAIMSGVGKILSVDESVGCFFLKKGGFDFGDTILCTIMYRDTETARKKRTVAL